LSIVFGWTIVEQFLAGAHNIDNHFVDTNPRHNLPVLLALVDVWNDTCLQSSARVVTPFTNALSEFPTFVAALESQTCGRTSETKPIGRRSCSSMVINGGSNGSFDRSVYQSEKVVNSEIVMALDCQLHHNTSRTCLDEDVNTAQDTLICSMFAHADELAFGKSSEDMDNAATRPLRTISGEATEGNRPSVLLMCGKLDAFACGQLIALSEHRALVKAFLWDIDPFVNEMGSSLRNERLDELRSEFTKLFSAIGKEHDEDTSEIDDHLNLSTKTLLTHYATLAKNDRAKTEQGR
jgi:glucose-6-phosphate isomerase